jgi:hypothetical protein
MDRRHFILLKGEKKGEFSFEGGTLYLMIWGTFPRKEVIVDLFIGVDASAAHCKLQDDVHGFSYLIASACVATVSSLHTCFVLEHAVL